MNEDQKALSAESIIAVLNEAERKLPVSTWEINGLQMWPAIRIELYYQLSMHLVSQKYSAPKSGDPFLKKIAKSMINFVKASLADYTKSNFIYKKADAVFLGDGTSFIKSGNLYYDKFFDPIIAYMSGRGYRTCKLERGRGYLIPRFFPSRFIQPSIDLSMAMAALKRRRSYKEHLPGLEDFRKLTEPFAPVISDFTAGYLRKKADTINTLKTYFSGILKKTRPRLAFMTSFYGDLGYAYIAACKENGVPVVDIQHGVQGPLHAAYGSWENVPASGYQFLPDYFWCWSASEYNTIAHWAMHTSVHRPVIGGNALLEAWKNNEMPDSGHYSALFEGIREKLKGRKTILYTMQYGLTEEADLSDTLTVISGTQHDYNWMIRLHPLMLEDMDKIKALLAKYNISNFNIAETTSAPLFAVLRQADVHITHSSSTVIEAMHFGIHSIVTNSYGISLYAEEIEKGWAIPALNIPEIIEKLAVMERSEPANGQPSASPEQAIETMMAHKR